MIARGDPLNFLRPATGKCLGAVFLAHDCDLRFFESVLATLLPIHADPQSDPERFLDEGRRRLRETPVVVVTDRKRYRGGRRLPHGLVLKGSTKAFYPRLSFLLFEDHARLLVGSANLTEGGYGGNAELVVLLQLGYKTDFALLSEVARFIESIGTFGEEWSRFKAQFDLLLVPSSAKPKPPWLLSTRDDASVLQQFLSAIPKAAKVNRVGILLAGQPEDDHAPETAIYDDVLTWLGERGAGNAPLDIALRWEGNAVTPPEEQSVTELESLLGRLCAHVEGPPGAGTISWVIPEQAEGQSLICRAGSRTIQLGKRKLKSDLGADPPRLWPIDEVVAVGPVDSVQGIAERANIEWWAFPALRLAEGQVYRRPLHAKLIAVNTTQAGRQRTHLLVGAPNFSPSVGGSDALCEAGLHMIRNAQLRISDLSQELVPCPAECLYLQASSYATTAGSAETGLEDAVHDAAQGTLVLNWKPSRAHRRVEYTVNGQEVELFDGVPEMQTVLENFELDSRCSELRVIEGQREGVIPVRVANIAHLLAEEPTGDLTFAALVQLFTAGTIRRAARLDDESESEGQQIPWDDLHPANVFRALQNVADEIHRSGASLGAFDVAMQGPLGVNKLAQKLLGAQDDPSLRLSEAWLYGQELCRTLASIKFNDDPVGRKKRSILETFVRDLRFRLALFTPSAAATPVLNKFYKAKR